MTAKLKPNQRKRAHLLAAVPVDRICRACKRPQIDLGKWRLTPFGDAVCLECRDRDSLANPDIYSDPVLRSAIWQRAIAEVKQARIKQARSKQLTPDVSCALCARKVSKTANRQEWVYVAKRDTWLCRKCYYSAEKLLPGFFGEDIHERIFLVLDTLKAQYPFGIQRIQRGSHLPVESQPACSYLYEQQRNSMWALVQSNLDLVNKHSEYLATRHNLDASVCYDRALAAAMRAATLYREDREKPFSSLLIVSIQNAVHNYLVRQHKKAIEIILSDLPEVNLSNEIDASIDADNLEARAARERRLDDYLTACIQAIEPADWYIFTTWVLGNRSQGEIGADLGIIAQSVGMRIAKVRKTCQSLAHMLKSTD